MAERFAKKILMLTDRMESGGAETHVAMLAKGLRERGAEVAVLSAGGKLAERLEKEGIRQVFLPESGRSPTAIWRNRALVREFYERERFDLLHAHARIPALYLPRGERKKRPACVFTVHADFRPLRIPGWVYGWGDRTVAVSEDLRAAVCDRFGVPAETVTVIPNGVDCGIFSPPDVLPPAGSVLFASRMDRDCALTAELLCDLAPGLAERFPEFSLTLAGGGDRLPEIRRRAETVNREHAEAQKRMTGREPERPLISLPGQVTDMPVLYRSHRIFVGVSRAALEAAACGCAVLLCGNEGTAGVLSPSFPVPSLSNFCCRGFPLPTSAALLRELCHLLSHAEFCRVTALQGMDWVRNEFTSDRMVDQTVRVYRKVLGEENMPPVGKGK